MDTVKVWLLGALLTAPFLGLASSKTNACQQDTPAQQLMDMIRHHELQQRPALECSEELNRIAHKKLEVLVVSPEFWHQAGRMTPNQWLRHHGYDLSISYPFIGNQVEALAGGEPEPDDAFQAFLKSQSHRNLLLGQDAFFKAQNQIGVAYLKDPDSDFLHYWAVLIADQSRADDRAPFTIKYTPKPATTQAPPKPKKKRKSAYERRVKRSVR